MKKKLMATLLALALVLSLVPMVFAAEGGGSDPDTSASASQPAEPTPTPSATPEPTPSESQPAEVTCDGTSTTEGECKAKTHTGNCIELCNKTSDCPGGTSHKTGCLKASSCQTGADNSDKTDCPRTTGHFDGCPKKCTTASCTKTKDHTDKHEGTACTNDSRCPVNAANNEADPKHTDGCPSSCTATGCNLNKGHAGLHQAGISCTGDKQCSVAGDGDHTANCPNKCNGEANCTALTHATNACKSQCKMSASCANTGDHHKENCVALCTYDSESAAEDNGMDCPNTSGDPTVHKAGCPKATVENSVVLDANGNPVESEKPGESEKPTEITKAEDFSDVNAGDWFAAELTTVIEKGWVKGNEDGSFDPNGDVSGEQAVVFVSRMLNKGFNTEGANWADEATKWAAEDGLTEGIEITAEGIARKDLVLLLWRAAGKPASEKEVTFTDLDGVEGDHLTALKWAVENGIILGNEDGTFTPAAATSRSQIAAILVRCDKAVNK
ncbi:MAG: hypothetical protein HFF26_03390 [Oscillospiraceae bacterium]|nr:hypothetical protein [Oscillospiraceae bacterium]